MLKARCVAGVDTLILRDVERGSFAVAREWTDLAAPDSAARVDGSIGYFELHSLCKLVALIEVLAARARGGLVK